MTTAQIERALYLQVAWLKSVAPYDKGNLSDSAINLERTGIREWRVYVDQKVAPYMPYTNEPWLSTKWKGHQNPNEQWWNKAIQEFMRRLARSLGGELKRD